MKVAVTGTSGLLGGALVRHLLASGHEVIRLVRKRPENRDEVLWYPQVDTDRLVGVDAVVHLVGETLTGRWSAEQREAIRESRVRGTRLLAEGLARMRRPPMLLCASATGFYGDRGADELTERSGSGQGFLAEVYRETEAAAEPAVRAGMRVTYLRYGVLQSPVAGGLAVLLPSFRLGLGVVASRGCQWVSWVSLPDAVRATEHIMVTDELAGPVNVVAPSPVTNRQYADTLARVLGRPRFLTLPPKLVRRVFGVGLANEVLLASTRAVPARLLSSGFRFVHPTLEVALRDLLLAVT